MARRDGPPEMVQVCPRWAERGIWVSLGLLHDPPISSPLQEGSPEEDVVAHQSNMGAVVLYKVRTRQDTMMALGIPKCHHGRHWRYMRLGTARGHHGGPQDHMEVGHGPGALW